MMNLYRIRVRLLSISWGIMFSPWAMVSAAQAEETVAYCDSPLHAVNVYQNDPSEAAEGDLRIRIFWREKSLVFADLPAERSRFSEGLTYTSQSGLADGYAESLWTLFVPSEEGQSCLLFRNGTAFDSGTVTQREQ